jgi:hypothetical protein
MTSTYVVAVDEQPAATAARSAVPWLTVIPLALVMAYADGFWVVALRGAVGAVQRTQTPFESWLRESTLALPVFAFAVLGALTLALRWFGPGRSRGRTMFAAALLIAAAGTLIGLLGLAASAAYDYHLQAQQLAAHHVMSGCGASCQQERLDSTMALDVRAVFYGIGLLLVSNLVVVGWVVALRGGRLDITASQRRPHALARSGRVDDLRLLLAVGLVGSAMVQAALVPAQLAEWTAGGVLLIVLAAVQLAAAGLVLVRPDRRVLLATATASLVPLLVWLCSRTIGLPFGPEAGAAEPVGLADGVAGALELGTLLVAVLMIRGRTLPGRLFGSAHASRLVLVAVVAAAALGLGGAGLA